MSATTTTRDADEFLEHLEIDGGEITLTNISKHFGGNDALKNVSVHVKPGTVHAFVGENGAGKSTLAKIVAGVHAPDGGSVEIDGEEVSFTGAHEAKAHGIAMVHQELSVLPSLTVAENVLFGMEPSRLGFVARKELNERSRRYLDIVGLDVSPTAPASTLSTPQQQLLEIAHAVASLAHVIILDEPSSSLATADATALMGLVRKLRNAGQTIILVSHDFDEVRDIADTITCLRDGELVTTCPASEVDNEDLIRLVTGRDIDTSANHAPQAHGDPILTVTDLTAAGVRRASFTLRPGEILGIGGLVGSGRSELLMALMGENPVAGGEIQLDGKPFAPKSAYDAIRRGLSLVPESRKEQGLLLGGSIRQNIEIASLDQIQSGPFASSKKAQSLADQYIQKLGIKARDADIPVEALSGGNQQKVVISKALASKPRILLLDEPTKGVDIGAKSEIMSIIWELAREGLAVLMVSSVIPELLTSCDRILIMSKGSIVGDLKAADTNEDEIARLAFSG